MPTLEDVKNEELGKLAKRLKGGSEKETLANILEWQERNIMWAADRWYTYRLLQTIVAFTILLLIVPFYWMNLMNPVLCWGGILVGIVTVVSLNPAYPLPALTPLTVYAILWLSLNSGPIITSVLILLALLLGGMIVVVIYLLMKYKDFYREFGFGFLADLFRPSLPVEKILRYRLGVCRDYAKLTAALLFNLYPGSKVCFLSLGGHVAAATRIKGKYYVLDQRLPVSTINRWLMRWDKRKVKVIVSKLKWGRRGEVVDVENWKKKYNAKREKSSSLNTKVLTEKVVKALRTKQTPRECYPDVEMRLKSFALYYEDDGVVEYSMVRAIKNRVEGELCGDVGRISRLEVCKDGRDNKDLIAKVWVGDDSISISRFGDVTKQKFTKCRNVN